MWASPAASNLSPASRPNGRSVDAYLRDIDAWPGYLPTSDPGDADLEIVEPQAMDDWSTEVASASQRQPLPNVPQPDLDLTLEAIAAEITSRRRKLEYAG